MRLKQEHRERFVKTLRRVQGRAVGFRIDRIRLLNGQPATREFLTHPGAVGVLAFTPEGRMLLVKQYRYPVHQFTLEIPAGKLDKGEQPLACVKRELEEETGYRAGRVRKLLSFWPTAAFSDEVIHLYQADRLTQTAAQPDDDEFLEIVHATSKQVARWIRSGKIRDSKTLIAFLAWKRNVAAAPKRRIRSGRSFS